MNSPKSLRKTFPNRYQYVQRPSGFGNCIKTQSMQVLGTIQHIILGKLEGEVFTNGWPAFTAVICQHDGVFTQSVIHIPVLNLLELSRAHA
jgi:hypothetical protein